MLFRNLRKAVDLFFGLFGNFRRSLILLAVLGLVSGFLESLGVSMLIPLLSHVLQQQLPDLGFITTAFSWLFTYFNGGLHLRILLPFIALIFLLRAAVLFLCEYQRTAIAVSYESYIRKDTYRLLLESSWPFLITQKIGFAENVIMNDVTKTTKLLSDCAYVLIQVMTVVIYVVAAIAVSPFVTFLTGAAGLTIFLLLQPVMGRIKKFASQIVGVNKEIAHDINESIIGLKAIKSMGLGNDVHARMEHLFNHYRESRLKQVVGTAILGVATQPASVIFVLAVFMFFFLQPNFNLGAFTVMVFLIQRIFIYVERIQITGGALSEQFPYAASLQRYRDLLKKHRITDKGGKPFSFKKGISFNEVTFAYENGRTVLSGVTFTIPKGNMLAIIGPSGVGKTTIADLLLRLLEPSKGAITVDDTSLADIAALAWHKHVGYVSQDLFLLNDSVFNNIRFYDDSIDEKAVSEAIRASALENVIKNLPHGIHTNVGDRGIALSAGQRQRIVLARVLARKPSILVLDEATSALDDESQRMILASIQKLHGNTTVIIIAHRLSTVVHADEILVLDAGKIVERGAPKEILTGDRAEDAGLS